LRLAIAHGVDRMQQQTLAFVFHPRLLVADERTMDRYGLACQEALIELVAFAVEAHHVVATHPSRLFDRHRFLEFFRSKSLARVTLGKACGGGTAQQAAVRSVVVLLGKKPIEPCLQGG
jgi:hypothetical protein